MCSQTQETWTMPFCFVVFSDRFLINLHPAPPKGFANSAEGFANSAITLMLLSFDGHFLSSRVCDHLRLGPCPYCDRYHGDDRLPCVLGYDCRDDMQRFL